MSSTGKQNHSMMGIGPEAMFVKLGPDDNQQRHAMNPFVHQNDWSVTESYIREDFDTTPCTGSSTALTIGASKPSDVVFRYDRTSTADLLFGSMFLTFHAGRQSGGAAVALIDGQTWVDNIAHGIDTVSFKFNGRVFYNIKGWQIVHAMQKQSPNARKFLENLAGGGFGHDRGHSLAARKIWSTGEHVGRYTASTVRKFHVWIPNPFDSVSKSFPIYGINGSLEVAVSFLPNGQLVHLAAAGGTLPTLQLDNFHLNWEGVHLQSHLRDSLIAQLFQGDGLVMKTSQIDLETATCNASSSLNNTNQDQIVNLRNAVGACYRMEVLARYAGNVQPASGSLNDLDPSNWLPITELEIKSGTRSITTRQYNNVPPHDERDDPVHTGRLHKLLEDLQSHPDTKPGLRNNAVINWSLPNHVEDSEHHAYGSRVLQQYNAPTLHFKLHPGVNHENTTKYDARLWREMPSAVTASTINTAKKNIEVIIAYHCHQVLMFGSGDVRNLFVLNQ